MAVATNWFDSHSFLCVFFIFNNDKIYRLEVV